MTKSNIILIGVIAAATAAIVVSVQIQRRTRAKLTENDSILHQQSEQLASLAADNQRLSNRVAQVERTKPTTSSGAPAEDPATELMRLRARVAALQQQSNDLAKVAAKNRRAQGASVFARGDFDLLDHNRELNITGAGTPRVEGKLNDARAITDALRKYALEHHGDFPVSFDPLTPYLPKPSAVPREWENAPLTGTNQFELVFLGSTLDLTNIPPRRIALIRETQPWPTTGGKWARVYGYADGAASTVESDDNFQSWEAQHVIPSGGNF